LLNFPYLCGVMEMKEPFDIELHGIIYSVFPEEDKTYTIFKEGFEYVQIQHDAESQWLKLDPQSGIPLFGMDEEVNSLGAIIQIYETEGIPDADEEE
jgi:hypothetical protein